MMKNCNTFVTCKKLKPKNIYKFSLLLNSFIQFTKNKRKMEEESLKKKKKTSTSTSTKKKTEPKKEESEDVKMVEAGDTKTEHSDDIVQEFMTAPPRVEHTRKPKNEPTSLSLFLTTEHHTLMAMNPVTLVVAKDEKEAYVLLDKSLASRGLSPSSIVPYKFTPIDTTHEIAWVLSVNPRTDGIKSRISSSYDELKPFVDEKANRGVNEVFICTNHYSRSPVSPASVIVAKNIVRAAELLDEALVGMGSKSYQEKKYFLAPVILDKPFVHSLSDGGAGGEIV
jgi:hypothetical protein